MADTAKVVNPGIGMPAALRLDEFGLHCYRAFGEFAYHVGSSLYGKQWRDVDVRVILSDEVYESMGLGDPSRTHENGKWVALCLAFATLGQQMTGLPIDFQIQQQTYANTVYPEPRGALILGKLREQADEERLNAQQQETDQ